MKKTIIAFGISLMILAACGGTAPFKPELISNQYGVVTVYTEPT